MVVEYQTVKGNVQLRGYAYSGTNNFGGYDANIGEDSAVGWFTQVLHTKFQKLL